MRNSDFEDSLADLITCWETAAAPSAKISSYFPVYAQLFGHLRGEQCVFIETGILEGGSLLMWRRWLGDRAKIVGVELNPAASKWKDAGFDIFIGDQGDPKFWQHVFSQVGPFDVLLDDGGHQSFQQMVTASAAIRSARRKCVIAVEDTATSFMRDFGNPSENSFLEFAKAATDCLVGRSFHMYDNRFPVERNDKCIELFKNVLSIQFYEGIVAFHIDPGKVIRAAVVRNMPSVGQRDFRYDGKESALVDWPNVLRREERIVKRGASSNKSSIVAMVSPKLRNLATRLRGRLR